MDPFTKGKHLALMGHLALLGVILVAIAIASWNEKHQKPAGTFTMVAISDAGLGDGKNIGGNAAAAQAPEPETPPEPAAPEKEAEPTPSPIPAPAALPKVELPKSVPQPTKPKPTPKPKPKATPVAKPSSYADFLKSNPTVKPLGTKSSKKTSAKSPSPAPTPSGPSFGEALSEGLSKKLGAAGSSGGSGSSATAVGDRTFGSGGLSGLGGTATDAESIYIGTVYTYLNSVWNEPKQLGSIHLRAKVQFDVDEQGGITSWRIVSGSGSDEFDQSVATVFAKVKRVSAPPARTTYRLFIEFETRQK